MAASHAHIAVSDVGDVGMWLLHPSTYTRYSVRAWSVVADREAPTQGFLEVSERYGGDLP
ncbi:hypothetical protein GCM10022420_081720 [Streptomyces iranensis]